MRRRGHSSTCWSIQSKPTATRYRRASGSCAKSSVNLRRSYRLRRQNSRRSSAAIYRHHRLGGRHLKNTILGERRGKVGARGDAPYPVLQKSPTVAEKEDT